MPTVSKNSVQMKVFAKGQVVIPVALRKRYRIAIGDQIDVIPTSDGILLKSVPGKTDTKPLTKRLFGIFSKYVSSTPKFNKASVTKATEKGFAEKWEK